MTIDIFPFVSLSQTCPFLIHYLSPGW